MSASDAPSKPDVRKPHPEATTTSDDSTEKSGDSTEKSGDSDTQRVQLSREANELFQSGTRIPALRGEITKIVPSDDQLLAQLAESQPASSQKIKGDNGYAVTVDKNAQGQVTRIAETDGTEWRRSADGKFVVLSGSNEKIPVKDLKVNSDGTYSIIKSDGSEIRRNADHSVGTVDANGNETQRRNQTGSVLQFDEKHRVIATLDDNGTPRGYAYGADGKLNAVVDPDGSVWRSNDGKSWQNQATKQLRGGDVKIESNGSQTIENANGGSSTLGIDGSLVSRDKQGRVTEVKDGDGKEQRFGYDAAGKLNAIKQADGTVYTSKDGTNWQQQDGRAAFKAEVSVDANGAVHQKYESGRESIQRTDGWSEIKENGKSLLTKTNSDGSNVVKNSLDQTLQITNANGKVHRFEYDEQGRVNKISDEKGTISTTDGKSWKGADGREVFQGRIEVGADGTYREVKTDNSRVVSKTDGSSITVDGNNHITRIEQANGNWRNFDVNARGQIVGVSDNNGNKLSTTDGVNWHNDKTGENKQMNVRISENGSYTEISANGDRRVSSTDGRTVSVDRNSRIQSAEARDGAVVKYSYDQNGRPSGFEANNPNGSRVSYDAQGHVTRTEDSNHQVREFKYDSKGQLSEMKDADGKTWKTQDGQNWASDKGDKYTGKVWVAGDGTYNYTENNSITTKQLDGTTMHREATGATRVENKDGQVTETTDAKGVKRTYERDAQGKLNKFTEGDDSWTSQDGQSWTSSKNGAKWQGSVSVDKDGTNYREGADGNKQWQRPDGSTQNVDYKSMEKAADAIEYSFNGGLGWGTDRQTLNATLESKTFEERKTIEQIWNQKYGTKYGYNLEQQFAKKLSGSDLDKSSALLKRPDGADNAGTLRVALTEGHEWSGRSKGELNKVIRNTLETMSAADIAKTDAEYQKRYGTSLRDAIMNDPYVNDATKDAVKVYLKGADQRTPTETIDLAQKAAKSGDAEMFQEAMRRAPKEARDYFASPEGQKLLKDNFEGHWYNVFSGNMTDTDYNHVKDYAQFGKLSVASQVNDNTSWLGDNEKAIEKSLADMNDAERKSYDVGRKLAQNQQVDDSLTSEQKQQALDYYNKTHEKLQAAAGQWYSGDSQVNELAKWEDMITSKGGSLVSRLAEHRGTIYDSSMQDVISSVENMSKTDWEKLHNDPSYKDKIQTVLKTYLSDDEYNRTMSVINAKAGADSFEASQQNRRPLLDTIEDNRHWYGDNKDKMYEALSNMTDGERDMYKRGSDPRSTDAAAKQFASAVDEKLKSTLSESGQKVAQELLDKVKRGEKPEMAIIDKLNIEATHWFGDKAQTIRDIQTAFDKDKGLQARLAHPQTEADKAYAEKFKDAARRATGDSAYEKYAKPLIETGHVPTELQLDLNRGIFNDDEQGAYKDIQRASAEEKQRILTDKNFQDRVLGFLSDSERQVALNSMRQGEMRPEDKLRSYQLGFGTSETEIKQTLAELNDRTQLRKDGKSESEIDSIIQQRLQNVRDEYAKKYGTDLSADFVANLSGKDLNTALRDVNGRDTRSQYLYTLDEASTTRSGFGSGFVDRAWDGTGYQLDDKVNQMAAAMVNNPDQARDYMEKVQQAIEMHQSSKEGLADAVVDTSIATVAVGGAFFTGGASLSLLGLTTMGAAAAGLKVGTKALIMGGDYNLSQAKFDGATGFADGFTALLVLGGGKTAAEKVIAQAGKSALRQGTEQSLKEGTEALIKQGLTKGVGDGAFMQLAKQVAKPGEEQAVAALLKQSITESVEKEARGLLKRLVTQIPQNVLSTSAGGAASGIIRGAHDAHDLTEFAKIAGTSTAFAAFGGAVAPFILEPGVIAGTKVWSGVKSKLSRDAAILQEASTRAKLGPAEPHDANALAAPKDSGTAPRDSGTPPRDTGTPPRDTGTPPRDTGTPPRDSQTPADTYVRTSNDQPLPKPESTEQYKVTEYKPQSGQPDVVAQPEAVRQSNSYQENGELRGKVQDGFQIVGGETRIGTDGNFHDPNRPSVVLDRSQDKVLRDTIAEAHARFDSLKNDPEKLAQELAKFSKEKMEPTGWSNKEVDDAQAMFRSQNANKQVLLGDYINRAKLGEGGGACQEQALLMKVLGDDFGLDISMSTGYLGKTPKGGLPAGYNPNHAFTELHLKDQTLVFDPRNEISGTPIDNIAHLTPTREFRAGETTSPEALQLKAGDSVSHDSTQWKVTNETPSNPGNLVLRRDGQLSVAPQELAATNPTKKLTIGEQLEVNVNGNKEGGWTVVGTNPDGTVKLSKADAVKVEIPPKQLATENPQLARLLGNDNHVLAGSNDLKLVSADLAKIQSGVTRSGLSEIEKNRVMDAIRSHLRNANSSDFQYYAEKLAKITDWTKRGPQLREVIEIAARHEPMVQIDMLLRTDATDATINQYVRLARTLDQVRSVRQDAQDRLAQEISRTLDEHNASARFEDHEQINTVVARYANQTDNITDAMAAFRARSYSKEMTNNFIDLIEMGADKRIRMPMSRLMAKDAHEQAVNLYVKLTRESLPADLPGSLSEGHRMEWDSFAKLRELSAQGKPDGWIFVPAMHGSTADSVGIDGLFINPRTNEFAPVDIAKKKGTVDYKKEDNKGGWAMPVSDGRHLFNSFRLENEVRSFISQVDNETQKPLFVMSIDRLSPPNGRGDLPMPEFRKVSGVKEAEFESQEMSSRIDPTGKEKGRIEPTGKQMQELVAKANRAKAGKTDAELFYTTELARRAHWDDHRIAEGHLADEIRTAIGNASDARRGPEIKPPGEVKARMGLDEQMDRPDKFPYIEFEIPGRAKGEIKAIRVYPDGNMMGVKMDGNKQVTYPLGSVKSNMEKISKLNLTNFDSTRLGSDTPLRFPDLTAKMSVKEAFAKYPSLELLGEAVTKLEQNKIAATTNYGYSKAATDVKALIDKNAAIKEMTEQQQHELALTVARARAHTNNPTLPVEVVRKAEIVKNALGPNSTWNDALKTSSFMERLNLAESDAQLAQTAIKLQGPGAPIVSDETAYNLAFYLEASGKGNLSQEMLTSLAERYKGADIATMTGDLDYFLPIMDKIPDKDVATIGAVTKKVRQRVEEWGQDKEGAIQFEVDELKKPKVR
ncbi:MAG TPA: hypothetical protein V6C76_16875 [Drouetiella sp.]